MQLKPWLILFTILALVTLGLLVGLNALLPYFRDELRRLEPWKAALIWFGDAVTLGWFLWYFVKHAVGGVPLRSRELAGGRFGRDVTLAGITLLLGLLADLAVTLMIRNDEENAFHAAAVARGEVYRQ